VPAHYSPGFNFHPHYPSNNQNTGCGFGRATDPTTVFNWAEMHEEPEGHSYRVRTGYVKRDKFPLAASPYDSLPHRLRVEVLSWGSYKAYWDDVLFADIEEKSPVSIMANAAGYAFGLRLDFLSFRLGEFYVDDLKKETSMFVDIEALAARYRAAGLTVDILPGAHTRAARMYAGSGYPSGGPRMLDRHHTAQPTSMTDAQSIAYMTYNAPHPVICNTYPHRDRPGHLTICAAGPSYTAGKGGPLGNVPKDRGNQYGWSMEAPNNGVGEPWSNHLQNTMVTMTAVECEFFGLAPTRDNVPAHFEWTSRKIDPAGPSRFTGGRNEKWNMGAFRAAVAVRQDELYGAGAPERELEMRTCFPFRVDSRTSQWQTTLKAGEEREVWLTLPPGAKAAGVNVVMLPKSTNKPGLCTISGTKGYSGGNTVNWSSGNDRAQGWCITTVGDGKKVFLTSNRDADFVIDVTGVWWN